MSNTPQRFLVAQTLFLGDVILAIPLLRTLRSKFPDSQIDVLVREETAPLLRRENSVSEIIVYSDALRRRGIRGAFSLATQLRARRYDVALILPGSARTALAVYLARIPRRIGTNQATGIDLHLHLVKFPKVSWYIPGGMILKYAGELYRLLGGRGSFLTPLFTEVVALDPFASALARNLQLLKPLGLTPEGTAEYASILPGKEDFDASTPYLQAAGGSTPKTVAIAPGSFWKTKRWPAEKFAELIQGLLSADMSVVLVGGEADREVCGAIVSRVADPRLMNACARLTILGSAALLTRCCVLVTNDSAAMHLAAAMGVPVVVLLGPTVREFGFIPPEPSALAMEVPGLWCRPCTPFGGSVCPTGTFECMEGIPVASVLKAVGQLSKSHTSRWN